MRSEWALAILIYLFDPTLSCAQEGGYLACRLVTSNASDWFTGLNTKWKPVKVSLVFDSVHEPSNQLHQLSTSVNFENTYLMVDVYIEVNICANSTNNKDVASVDCLDERIVVNTLNDVIAYFPKVSYLHMILNSFVRPVHYSFQNMAYQMLEEVRIDGFRLRLEGSLVNLSSKLKVLSFVKADIKSLNEIFSPGCCGTATNLILNSNMITDLSSPVSTPTTSFKLKSIELKKNSLTRIEADNFLKQLSELESLHLCENRINFIDARAFDGLTKLQYLSLRDNDLADVPVINSIVGSPYSLRELVLRNNKIVSVDVDKSFGGIRNLNILDLRNNQLATFRLSDVLEKLMILQLSNNKLTLLEVVTRQSIMTTLNLDGNELRSFSENLLDFVFNVSSSSKMWVNVSGNPLKNCELLKTLHGPDIGCLPSPTICTYEEKDRLVNCSIGGRLRTIRFDCPNVTEHASDNAIKYTTEHTTEHAPVYTVVDSSQIKKICSPNSGGDEELCSSSVRKSSRFAFYNFCILHALFNLPLQHL